MTTTAQKRWLSKQEAADYLNLSLMSLRRLREEGKLHTHNPVPGRSVFDRQELDTYMESCRAESGTQS
jgi:excisionase family DNA binding protein